LTRQAICFFTNRLTSSPPPFPPHRNRGDGRFFPFFFFFFFFILPFGDRCVSSPPLPGNTGKEITSPFFFLPGAATGKTIQVSLFSFPFPPSVARAGPSRVFLPGRPESAKRGFFSFPLHPLFGFWPQEGPSPQLAEFFLFLFFRAFFAFPWNSNLLQTAVFFPYSSSSLFFCSSLLGRTKRNTNPLRLSSLSFPFLFLFPSVPWPEKDHGSTFYSLAPDLPLPALFSPFQVP